MCNNPERALFIRGKDLDYTAGFRNFSSCSRAIRLLMPQARLLEHGHLLRVQFGKIDSRNLGINLRRIAELDLLRRTNAAHLLELRHFVLAIRGEQLLDLVLEHRDVRGAHVLGVDAAVAADQERGGQAQDAAVEFGDPLVAHGHGVIHLELAVKVADRLDAVVQRNPDHHQALIAVALLEFDEPGDLNLARATPRRPKIQQHDFALLVGQINFPPVEVT
ncbi:MAG: hypothetical protein LAO07_10185 [Acidobacteriia bacterium]|nr:hypothetical protein [Terriglobia bacterium]